MVNKDINSQQSHISGAYSPTRIKTQIITSFRTVVQRQHFGFSNHLCAFKRTSVRFASSNNNPSTSQNEGFYVLTGTCTAVTVWTVWKAGATLGGFSMIVLPSVPLAVSPCPGFLVSTIRRVITSTITDSQGNRNQALKDEGALDHIPKMDHSPFGIITNIRQRHFTKQRTKAPHW